MQELRNGVLAANVIPGLKADEWLWKAATGNSFPLLDVLGSTVAVVNAVGDVETAYTYEPFGRTLTSGNQLVDVPQFTGR